MTCVSLGKQDNRGDKLRGENRNLPERRTINIGDRGGQRANPLTKKCSGRCECGVLTKLRSRSQVVLLNQASPPTPLIFGVTKNFTTKNFHKKIGCIIRNLCYIQE
jgi:hypothetical protein